MCCENNSIPDSSGATPAGRFGSYACDSPIGLIQSALSFMNASANNNVSWVLWTGDDTPVRSALSRASLMLPQHNIFGQNMMDNLENIRRTSQFMLDTFPNTVIVPLLGASAVYMHLR